MKADSQIPAAASRRNHRRAAFSQVEVAMSALIAGLILSAALNLAGAATRGQLQNRDQSVARLVGGGLMGEILAQPFEDPNQTPVFGPEPGESTSPASRSLFDDVDDYHNWNSSPQTRTGSAVADSGGITTLVKVTLADPTQLGAGTVGTPSSEVKRVVVQVLRGSSLVSEFVGVKTK